jgi:hypothetical protein
MSVSAEAPRRRRPRRDRSLCGLSQATLRSEACALSGVTACDAFTTVDPGPKVDIITR